MPSQKAIPQGAPAPVRSMFNATPALARMPPRKNLMRFDGFQQTDLGSSLCPFRLVQPEMANTTMTRVMTVPWLPSSSFVGTARSFRKESTA